MEYLPEVNKLRLTGDTRALNVFILNAHFVGAALQDGVTGSRACDIAISSQEHLDSKLEGVRELCDEFGWQADTVSESSQACERPCAVATRVPSTYTSAQIEDHTLYNSPPATPPRTGKDAIRNDETEKDPLGQK